MSLHTTYTYANLEVSSATFREIWTKLEAAGYHHALHTDGGQILIDMHGIALVPPPPIGPDELMTKLNEGA